MEWIRYLEQIDELCLFYFWIFLTLPADDIHVIIIITISVIIIIIIGGFLSIKKASFFRSKSRWTSKIWVFFTFFSLSINQSILKNHLPKKKVCVLFVSNRFVSQSDSTRHLFFWFLSIKDQRNFFSD